MGKETGQKLPRGISIRQHASGMKTIYITFSFMGVTCRERFIAPGADPSNIQRASNLRGEILNKISLGQFRYADYFPKSKQLKHFGIVRSDMTLTHYFEQFIKHAEIRQLKPSSMLAYHSRVNGLRPDFGHLLPSEVNEALLRDVTIKYQVEHQLSKATIQNRMKVLKDVLYEAVNDGLIHQNPMDGFKLYRYVISNNRENKGEKIDPFKPDEIKRLLQCAPSKHVALMIKLWLKTGLRTGELCALKWKKVSFRKKNLRIDENYVSMVAETGTPKTKNSDRDIRLEDEELIDVLKQLKQITGEQVLVLVNPNTGGQWDSYSIRRMFIRLCKTAQVRYRYPYQLRHTFATIQISQGRNLWDISNAMGHKDPSMLYQTYGRFIREYELMKDGLFEV